VAMGTRPQERVPQRGQTPAPRLAGAGASVRASVKKSGSLTVKQRLEEKFKIGNGESQQRKATLQLEALPRQLEPSKKVLRCCWKIGRRGNYRMKNTLDMIDWGKLALSS